MPVSSRSVRPAGNQHLYTVTSLAVLVRHARYLLRMGVVAARCSRSMVPAAGPLEAASPVGSPSAAAGWER